MSSETAPDRPVPRWLHVWAVAVVVVTFVTLLVLGQLVTSFRAGMADPVWPTEPWYLLNNYKLDAGYLIEHAHRIAGFLVGTLAAGLVLCLWATTPSKAARWVGLAALVVLLLGYYEFHKAMRAQRDPSMRPTVPVGPVGMMAAALGVVVALGAVGMVNRVRGSGLRLVAVATLVAVMVQGLLGGLRVRLDALFGTNFAIVHGVFAQVVFCLLVGVAVLTARPAAGDVPESARRLLNRLSLGLVAVLLVQLVWGALVRHTPNPLNQRLHLLTAFLVVAVGVWLLRVGFVTARPRVAAAGWVLGVFLALQVTLGVEAWMTKFGEEARRGRAAASFLPEAERVTKQQAAIRTAHTLIGTGILAAAAVLALRVRMPATTRPDGGFEVGFGRRAVPRHEMVGAGQPGETTC